LTATGQNLYAESSKIEQDSSSESSAAVDILHHGTGVPPLRLFAPPGILANGGRKADELEELDEEPELSELKVVETEFVEAGATASGEATSGGLSAYFRRNDLCTSVISAVSAGSSSSKVGELALYAPINSCRKSKRSRSLLISSLAMYAADLFLGVELLTEMTCCFGAATPTAPPADWGVGARTPTAHHCR